MAEKNCHSEVEQFYLIISCRDSPKIHLNCHKKLTQLLIPWFFGLYPHCLSEERKGENSHCSSLLRSEHDWYSLEAATNSKKVVMDLLTLQILRTLRKVLLAKCLSKLISRPIQGLERAKSPSKVCARNQLLTLSLITDQNMFLFQLVLAFSCCCQRFEMAQGANVQAVRGGELDRPASVR